MDHERLELKIAFACLAWHSLGRLGMDWVLVGTPCFSEQHQQSHANGGSLIEGAALQESANPGSVFEQEPQAALDLKKLHVMDWTMRVSCRTCGATRRLYEVVTCSH